MVVKQLIFSQYCISWLILCLVLIYQQIINYVLVVFHRQIPKTIIEKSKQPVKEKQLQQKTLIYRVYIIDIQISTPRRFSAAVLSVSKEKKKDQKKHVTLLMFFLTTDIHCFNGDSHSIMYLLRLFNHSCIYMYVNSYLNSVIYHYTFFYPVASIMLSCLPTIFQKTSDLDCIQILEKDDVTGQTLLKTNRRASAVVPTFVQWPLDRQNASDDGLLHFQSLKS